MWLYKSELSLKKLSWYLHIKNYFIMLIFYNFYVIKIYVIKIFM